MIEMLPREFYPQLHREFGDYFRYNELPEEEREARAVRLNNNLHEALKAIEAFNNKTIITKIKKK